MEPILKYPGAKWKIAEWIIERMPPHVGYVEPFFGSGAVFFNKQKSKIETIADLDGSIIRFFKTCREHPEELAYALSMTPWSREEFLRSDFCDSNVDDIEAARQFAVRCWQTFGARTHCKTGWRNTTARTDNPGPDNPKLWRRLPKIVIQVADRLLDAQIENRPAIEVIEHNNGNNVLIYADPPYMKNTRTLNGDQYRHEMSDRDHEKLLEALKKHKGMVLLSGYDSPMYRDMLTGWRMETRKTTAEKGVNRTEILWSNPAVMEAMPYITDLNYLRRTADVDTSDQTKMV